MPRVAVIGAGIAGLSAANRLRLSGIEPIVFEAEADAGGVISTEKQDGFLLERGPNSIQSGSPLIHELIAQHGLEDRVVQAGPAARNRYVVRAGRPHAAPLSPLQFAGSSLFGGLAKMSLLREPFVAPADPRTEESVADFVRRRLGREFLDYGMNPFVGGVYAGDPERLSIRYAFPSLYEMEQKSGSIIKGQMDQQRDASSAAETHRMFSFRDGMAELPRRIASTLKTVRYRSPVEKLFREDGKWFVHSEQFDAVVATAPLHRLSPLLKHLDIDTTPLRSVSYPPLSVVVLGFRRLDVGHPLDGFGMLVPQVESAFSILGTLFTSSIFPGRAPEGHVLLTTFVGGARRPDLAHQTSDHLFAVVLSDISRLLHVSGQPVFSRHVYWKNSIPQYEIGYGRVITLIERLERALPGFFMAGNYRSGISVGDAAQSGDNAARRCAEFLFRSSG